MFVSSKWQKQQTQNRFFFKDYFEPFKVSLRLRESVGHEVKTSWLQYRAVQIFYFCY